MNQTGGSGVDEGQAPALLVDGREAPIGSLVEGFETGALT